MEVIEHHRVVASLPHARKPALLERQLSRSGAGWAVLITLLVATLLAWELAVRHAMGDPADASGWLLPTLVAVAALALELLLFGIVQVQARRTRMIGHEVHQRRAEADERTLWLDAVSGLSPDGALVFERDAEGLHRLVFTNPAFSQLFMLRPSDLLGLSEPAVDEWLAGLASDSVAMPPLLAGADVTVQLAGPPVRVLRRSAREDGRQRVYYFRDITRESEVDRLKSEFLTTAAHELRTPLASVYGFSELLTRPHLTEDKRADLAEIIHRQAGVLKHLVDELMDLARIDARGDRDFHRSRCDLREVVATANESVRMPTAQHPVSAQLSDQPLWVMADAVKLQQAVVNALSNAQKYSPAGSPIVVCARKDRRDASDWAVLSVSDHGMGMSPEQTARAFERFYRADPSGHVLGAGLGLAIIHEVLSLHGGRVELQSELGKGTELRLWLPLLPAPLTS